MGAGKTAAIAIGAVLVGIAIGYGAGGATLETDVVFDEEPRAVETSALSGDVDIGLILPITGDLSTHGTENLEGSRLGVEDFNAYLDRLGAGWQLNMVAEDSATSPVVALEKLTALNSRGIKLVVGPETSANTSNVKSYADSNGMVLMSCCSSAPSLAIAGDSIFRLVPDDSNQGRALAKVIQARGVDTLIVMNRGDAWGDGLNKTTSESFAALGGAVLEPIRYTPEQADFSAAVSLLAERVGEAREAGAGSIGVAMISFAETVQIMQSASTHPELADTTWFGAGATTKEHQLVDDPIARDFSNDVTYTTVQVSVSNNEIYQRVESHLIEEFGRAPSTFVHTSYDIPWLYGMAMLQTGTDDASEIRAAIPEVAAHFYGATGPTKLNDAGDLAASDYEIWGIEGDEWVHLGKYTNVSGTVAFDAEA